MTNVTRKINPREAKALAWLNANGGHGTFDADGQCITATNGATIDYTRAVWVGLRDAQRIEFYNDGDATPFGAVRVL